MKFARRVRPGVPAASASRMCPVCASTLVAAVMDMCVGYSPRRLHRHHEIQRGSPVTTSVGAVCAAVGRQIHGLHQPNARAIRCGRAGYRTAEGRARPTNAARSMTRGMPRDSSADRRRRAVSRNNGSVTSGLADVHRLLRVRAPAGSGRRRDDQMRARGPDRARRSGRPPCRRMRCRTARPLETGAIDHVLQLTHVGIEAERYVRRSSRMPQSPHSV